MPSFETVRVAAVQATPVILDAEASIDWLLQGMWRDASGVG